MIPYLLNLADLALTLHALSNGGVEINPLMQSVPVMVLYKVVVVGILYWSLEKIASDEKQATKNERLARWGLRGCTVVYAVLFLYHLYFVI